LWLILIFTILIFEYSFIDVHICRRLILLLRSFLLFLNPISKRICHSIYVMSFLLTIVRSMIACWHTLTTLETAALFIFEFFILIIYLYFFWIIPLPSRHTYLLAVLISSFLFLFFNSHGLICKVLFDFLTLLLVKMEEFFTFFNHILFIFVNKNWLHNELIKSMKVFWTSFIHTFGTLFISLEVWMQDIFFRVFWTYRRIKAVIISILILYIKFFLVIVNTILQSLHFLSVHCFHLFLEMTLFLGSISILNFSIILFILIGIFLSPIWARLWLFLFINERSIFFKLLVFIFGVRH